MSEKVFKTLDEQLEILKSRGLNIDNDAIAKEFLLNNNYYRISGYSLTLRNHDLFYSDATFQNIMDIYSFDHELRHILLKYLEIIEVEIKSVYAYEFSRLYGGTGYLTSSNFTDAHEYLRIMRKAEDQKNKRLSHEAFLKHYVEELHEDIPLWAFVDLLTIADISMLYHISHDSLKHAVANHYELAMKSGSDILGAFLHELTIIRNLCAHGSRLFNRLFIRKPSLNRKEKALLCKDEKGNIDNSHLYGFILVMRRLLPKEQFHEMRTNIIQICKKYPFVSMKYYGFRDDWEEVL